MNQTIEVVKRSILLFPKSDIKKIYFIVVLYCAFGLLDLAGVVLIGLIAALTVSEVGGGPIGDRTSKFLDFIGITSLSAQEQVIVIGLFAVSFLVSKSLLSMYFSKRYLLFLGRSAGRLSSNLIARYFREGLTRVQTRTVHETIFLLTGGVNAVARGIIGAAISLVSDLSLLLILGIGIFYVEPIMAMSTLALFTLVGVGLHYYTSSKVHRLAKSARELSIQASERIAEIQFAFKEVYTKNQREFYINSMIENRMSISETEAKQSFLQGFGKYFFELTFVIGAFVIASYQFFTSPAGRAITILGIFFAASGRIMPAILRIQSALINIRGFTGAAEPTLKVISELSSPGEDKVNLSDSEQDSSNTFFPKVSASNLVFGYGNSSLHTLDKVSFNAEPGEFVAIVGPSGAGKSTLVDVLLGLRDPKSGSASISGLDPKRAIKKWGGNISYIPQDCMVFPGTIKRNIGLGFPESEISDSMCWHALKLANLEEFVQSLPGQLNEQVGEMGTRLSGGQRQRIGIARALYTNPKIIFFDEATSSLDALTEAEISKSIMGLRGSKTIITIAHRLSTVVEADKIYFMSEGKVTGVGTFQELRNKIPEFAVQANLMGL